jgi:hypothetical protein
MLGVGACLIACVTAPGSLAAQLALEGAPRPSSPPASVSPVRWPDVAFDPASDVFLAVSGAGHVGGLLVASSGEPLGAPFVIDEASMFAQAPRVTHVEGAGFLVAWHETVGDATELRGRLVRADGSFATGDLVLLAVGTNWEMASPSAIGVKVTSHETPSTVGDPAIGARRPPSAATRPTSCPSASSAGRASAP